MISASHNPALDNGIKFFGGDGFKLVDDQELEIEALLDAPEDTLPRPSAEGLCNSEEFQKAYLSTTILEQTINGDLSDLTVCIDAANGATATTVNRLFADLETEFYTIGTKPNGLNINDGVGSTHPESLAAFVVEKGADAGLAFDGDGDRVIAVDELGNIVDGDKIMYICAKYLASKKRLKQDTIVTTVMSKLGFHKAVEEIGLRDVITQVKCYVVEEMRKTTTTLVGSNPAIRSSFDFNTTGDGCFWDSTVKHHESYRQEIVRVGGRSDHLSAKISKHPRVR